MKNFTAPMSTNRLLNLLFRVSYRALNKYTHDSLDFTEWVRLKRRFNYCINVQTFKYLASNKIMYTNFGEPFSTQLRLDALDELLLHHYKIRQRIIQLAQNLPFKTKTIFVWLSLCWVYFYLGFRALLSTRHLLKKFSFIPKVYNSTIVMTVDFPRHSFSIPNKNQAFMGIYQSLGEYLNREWEDNPHTLISLDERERHSKAKEKQQFPPSSDFSDSTLEFERISLQSNLSIKTLFCRIPSVLKSTCQSIHRILVSRSSLIVELYYLEMMFVSCKYLDLIKEIELGGNQIQHIFLLPFQWKGVLKYLKTRKHQVKTLNYSENILLPPAQHIQSLRNSKNAIKLKCCLSEAPLSAFRLSTEQVGFSEICKIMDQIKVQLNEKLNVVLPVPNIKQLEEKNPSMLGFESIMAELDNNFEKRLAIFDVPPESRRDQLRRSIIGDWTCGEEVVAEFAGDIIEVIENWNVQVIFKPKYSLTNCSESYRNQLQKFKKKLGNRFLMISPYTSVPSAMSQVDMTISMPYTSTKKLSEIIVSCPSVYYISEAYRDEFSSKSQEVGILIGKKELEYVFCQSFK